MTGYVVSQRAREAAADFMVSAWHLFWPDKYQNALDQSRETREGYHDNWLLVQALAKFEHETLELRAKPEHETRVTVLKEAAEFVREFGSGDTIANNETATCIEALKGSSDVE